MKNKHAINKVRTRNKELNDKVLYSYSVKTQYLAELYRRKQTQYYSTDESSYSDSDSDISDSDSDDNKLVIDLRQTVKDINHSIKSISETNNEITQSKQLIQQTVTPHSINEALNQNNTTQLHEVKAQDLGFSIPINK